MRWRDEGILIWRSSFGEGSMTVGFLTCEHGLHAGLVRCSGGARRGVLQPGNMMDAQWSARLAEHLGNYVVALRHPYGAYSLRAGRESLLALNSVCALLRAALPERLPVPRLFAHTRALVELLAHPQETKHDTDGHDTDGHDTGEVSAGCGLGWAESYCLWELALLEELGYGLDMERCALGGDSADLAYISPRTGRAASYEKAANYENKLLKLPYFLREATATNGTSARKSDLQAALKLTGYFLQERILAPLGKNFPRERYQLATAFN